jgi:hypothetical protein
MKGARGGSGSSPRIHLHDPARASFRDVLRGDGVLGRSRSASHSASARAETAGGVIKAVKIGGDVVGDAQNSAAIGAALGAIGGVANVSIGKVAIFGSMIGGEMYSATISANHIASILIGGSLMGGDGFGDGFFGTADDTRSNFGNSAAFTSKIASIVIKGRGLGTVGGADHFGFVAQEIGALTIGAVKFPLTKLAGNDDLDANDPLLLVSRTGALRVHEVAAP